MARKKQQIRVHMARQVKAGQKPPKRPEDRGPWMARARDRRYRAAVKADPKGVARFEAKARRERISA